MGKRDGSVKVSPKKSMRCTGVDLNELTDARSSGSYVSKRLHDNKVHVWVRPFCSKGSVYDSRFGDERLDVVQFACKTTAESPLYQLKHRVDQFCKHMREHGQEDVPIDFTDFEETYGAFFTFVGKQFVDTDKVGMIKNRIGFFCKCSSVKNLLMLLDDVWKYCLTFSDLRVKTLTSVPDVVVHVPAEYGLRR